MEQKDREDFDSALEDGSKQAMADDRLARRALAYRHGKTTIVTDGEEV